MGRRIDAQALERRVERELADRLPAVDLLEFTVDGEMFRLVVDHPDGVTHDVCAEVTHALGDAGLLDDHGAEVWSPGPEPPLRTPDHFRAAIGHRVKVRVDAGAGRSSHTGTLRGVDDAGVRIEASDGRVVEVPFDTIRRARMLEEPQP